MNCKYYKSREAYYGVAGEVPVMTSGFWECEPDDEEVREYFLEWMDEVNDVLEPNYPDNVELFCDECEETFEFNLKPINVFTKEELYKVVIAKLKEWLKAGEIDEDDYKYNVEFAKKWKGVSSGKN